MNKQKNRVFSADALKAVFCALVLSACASSPAQKGEPAWVRDPYQSYNKAVYIAAVGHGPGRDNAEKDALAKLTAIFSQSVSSDSTSNYTYTQALEKSGTAWSENSGMAQTVKTSVKMNTLVGAEIKDVWDNGRGAWYASAAMDKAKTSLIYSELIGQNMKTIAKLTSLSAQDKQSFDGYARYQQAASFADANIVFANVMKVINPASLAGEEFKSGDDYRIEAVEIARNIPVAVIVENDKQGRIRGAFSQALSVSGFRTGGPDSRYVLRAALAMEEVSFPGNPYKWMRYSLEGSLTDTSTGVILFPYNISAREGQNSLAEAENKALRHAETSIKESYAKALGNFLSQSAGK